MIASKAHTSPTSPAAGSVLFVSTSLTSFDVGAEEAETRGSDRAVDGIQFRALDPAFYAWLRGRMERAKKLHVAGRIDQVAFEELRDRFNGVHAWAVEHLGQEALQRAIRETDTKRYSPPAATAPPPPSSPAPEPTASQPTPSRREHLFPADGDFPCKRAVDDTAVARVHAIRDAAIAAGWSLAALYQNRGDRRFPYGPDWGLVTCLDPGDTIGEVTPRSIEIVNAAGRSSRFYNPHPPR